MPATSRPVPSGFAGEISGVVEQRRLAEAGRGLEHHHAAVALREAVHSLFEHVELHCSLQQWGLGGGGVDVLRA